MSMPVWSLLASAMWTLIVLAVGVGIYRWSLIIPGKAKLNAFPGDEPHGPPFYRRAVRAHANCIENLPVFAAIVFAGYAAGARSPVLDALSIAVVAARVAQTSVHLISGTNLAVGIRFGIWCVQFAAFVWMAALIALHASAN